MRRLGSAKLLYGSLAFLTAQQIIGVPKIWSGNADQSSILLPEFRTILYLSCSNFLDFGKCTADCDFAKKDSFLVKLITAYIDHQID